MYMNTESIRLSNVYVEDSAIDPVNNIQMETFVNVNRTTVSVVAWSEDVVLELTILK